MLKNKLKPILVSVTQSKVGFNFFYALISFLPSSIAVRFLSIIWHNRNPEQCKKIFDKIIERPKLIPRYLKFLTLTSLQYQYRLEEFKKNFLTYYKYADPQSIYLESSDPIKKYAFENFCAWCNDSRTMKSSLGNEQNRDELPLISVPFHLFNRRPKNPHLKESIEMAFNQAYELFDEFIPFLQHDIHFNYFKPKKGITYHTIGNSPFWIHIKESPLSNAVNIDQKGFSGWISYASKSDSVFKDYQPSQEATLFFDTYSHSKESKYTQTSSATKREYDYIFIPLQIPNDQVAKLSEINTYDLLESLQSPRKEKFVIKRHPLCHDKKVSQLLKKLPASIEVVDENISHLIRQSKAVLTINSGVGFEAILQNKPVMSLGLSDYSIATQKINNLKNLDQDLIEASLKTKYYPNFLSFYYENCLFESKERAKLKLEKLTSNF